MTTILDTKLEATIAYDMVLISFKRYKAITNIAHLDTKIHETKSISHLEKDQLGLTLQVERCPIEIERNGPMSMVNTNDHFGHTIPITKNQHFLTMMHMKPNILESFHRNLVQDLSSKEHINSIYVAIIDTIYSSKSDTKF